jgi:thioredoxin-like negative regulator of GroEL/YHS domain-containing protein
MWSVRHLSVVAAVVATSVVSAVAEDKMPWQPNLEAAQQLAARTNRLVLIHFWAPWCQPCMRLEREVFSQAETARALEANFVLVKLNSDEAPGTTRMYGVSSLPTDVIIQPNGRLVSQFQSPPTANQYVAQLNQAAAGHRELARKSSPQISANAPVAGGVAPSAQSMAAPGAPPATPAAYPATSAPQASPAVAASPAAPYDRYAEYFQPPAGAPAAQPAAAQAPMAQAPMAQAPAVQTAVTQPYANQSPQQAMASPQGPPAAVQASPHVPGAQQGAYNAHASYQQQPPVPQLPPGCPPLGLDGNCPVTLVERMQWSVGDRAWGAVHRGRTYLFLGPQEREKFLANPDLYSPVLSGLDPVLAMDNQMVVAGRREFGVFGADRRIYLFADESSLKRFEANPKRYAVDGEQVRR